jgi:hypothetical protein
VDLQEAYDVGRFAVSQALTGRQQGMVTLERQPGPGYRCMPGIVDLDAVANREHKLPAEYMNASGNFPTPAFLDYVRPLVGEPWPPMPYVRLDKQFI